MSHSDIVKRVASSYLEAGRKTALPKSGPGKMVIKRAIEKLQEAFEDDDNDGFKSYRYGSA